MHYQDQYFVPRFPHQGQPPEYNGTTASALYGRPDETFKQNKKRTGYYVDDYNDVDMQDKGPPDLDYRATRFASAVLFLAVLVLVVDASRIIMYSWYTDATILKYIYGGRQDVDWSKCSGSAYVPPNSHSNSSSSPTTKSPFDNKPVNFASQSRALQTQNTAVVTNKTNDNSIQSKINSMEIINAGNYMIKHVFNSILYKDKAEVPSPHKCIIHIMYHASTAASLLFLFVAIFPAILRNHPSYCLICFGQLLAFLSVIVGTTAIISCLVKIFFFCLAELSPELAKSMSFVPQCSLLRKAYFCAECFSLLVLLACVSIVVYLKVFFCRSCCHCCCPEDEEAVTRRGGYAYDDEEYLA